MNNEHYPVIVIGAGMAGTKAAGDLTQAGVPVLMVEARDRTGGRINTVHDKDHVYDMGASWLHESLENELFSQSAGKTDMYYDDSAYVWYDKNGVIPNKVKAHRVMDEMMTSAKLYFMSSTQPDSSMAEFAHEYVNKHPLVSEQQKDLAPKMARFIELHHGIPWQFLSARYGGLEHTGRDAYVRGGYDTVYKRVYEEINQDRFTLELNTEVKSIASGKKIAVKTDNKTVTCDFLINTIPLGVLRKRELFENSLPPALQSVIDDCAYAALGKVYFEFDEVFWQTEEDRMVVLADVDMPGAKPRPFDCPVFFTNGKLIFGRPCLVSLIAPPLTQYIESNPDKVEEYFTPILEALRVDQTKPLPKIKSFKTTEWTLDPYALGSYSAFSTNDTFESKVGPFIEGADNLRFAGEHATLSGNGCTHGAYAAGAREAKYVLEHLKGSPKPSL